MGKRSALSLIAILTVSSLIVVDCIPLGLAESGTNEGGILISDTTWTRSNSPYTLSSNVLVPNGITLAIEAGVTVSLNGYYIEVNGTLVAIGTNSEPIQFNNGNANIGSQIYPITFTPYSISWNEQNSKGSIIQNSILNSVSLLIDSSSPKIKNNKIKGYVSTRGNANITLMNNRIVGGIQDDAQLTTVISDNTISADPDASTIYGYPIVYGISSRNHNDIVFTNNTITGFFYGMDVGYTKGIVSDNSIVGCQIGITTSGDSSPLIERNLIKESNQYGLMIQTANTIATSNTITGCRIGVVFGLSYESITHYLFGAQPSISNNNIFGNIKYNFYSKAEDNLVLTNNWWGTTDSQAINQTIYDFKNDFNLGIVNFIPFLNAPNPNAPAIQAPTRTPTPSPSPSPSPSTITPTPSVTPEPEPEPFPTTFIAAVFIATVALVSVGLLVYFKKRKHSSE